MISAVRILVCIFAQHVFAMPTPEVSKQELQKAEELTTERMREGKVDENLEKVIKAAQSEEKKLDNEEEQEEKKRTAIDAEFDKVTDKAQQKLESEKEKFEKRTDSDLEAFEQHEESIGEKFKEREEADMDKFEKALLPDEDVHAKHASSFMETGSGREDGEPMRHNVFDLSGVKKRLLEISETAENIAKKEHIEKTREHDRFLGFDEKLSEFNDKMNTRLAKDETDFENKIQSGVDAVAKKNEENFDAFKAAEEHDGDLFKKAMDVGNNNEDSTVQLHMPHIRRAD